MVRIFFLVGITTVQEVCTQSFYRVFIGIIAIQALSKIVLTCRVVSCMIC